MTWECPGCFATVESPPLAHDDRGGVIRIYGPRCEECDELMDFVEDSTEEEKP